MKFDEKHFWAFCAQLKIPTKEFGESTFSKPLGTQRYFIRQIAQGLNEDAHTFVALKGRQQGISTVMLALDLYWVFKYRGIMATLIAQDELTRDDFRAKIAMYYKSLPREWRQGSTSHNRNQFLFKNKSGVTYQIAGNRAGNKLGRGKAITFMHATEIGSWSNNKDGLSSLQASLAEINPARLFVYESPLSLDTPVPTPSGWSTIGALQPGDEVFGADGNICRVKGKSPVFKDRPCYRIELANGDSFIADGAHKWAIDRQEAKSTRFHSKVVKTDELIAGRDYIPVGDAMQMPASDLPIDPYLLGLWLGNGHAAAVRFSCHKDDAQEEIDFLRARGFIVSDPQELDKNGNNFSVRGLMPAFREAGLIGNKHIPSAYLRGSLEQRLDLVRGLMDTDGNVSKASGVCTFVNTNSQMMESLAELLATLGIKSTIGKVSPGIVSFKAGDYLCRDYYYLHFKTDIPVFNLKRKLQIQQKFKVQRPHRTKFTEVVKVTPCDSVPVQCIEVDSSDHLFRVGESMVCTHNTANGYDMFHDLYNTAETSVSSRAVFIPWWMNEFYAVDESMDNPVFRTYFGKPCDRSEVVKRLEQSEVGWYRAVQRQFDYSLSAGQIAWWRWKLNEQFNDLDMMLQEFPPLADYAFRLTGSQFFPSAALNDALETAKTAEFIPYNIRFGIRFQDMGIDECAPAYASLKIWQPAIDDARAKGHFYVLGADVAYGSSEWKDASVAHVYRCFGDKIELVCEYHSTQCNPTQFAWVIAFLAGLYGNTVVNLEVNGPGQVVYQELDQLARIAMSVKTTENREIGNVMRHIRHYVYNKFNGGSKQGSVRHWVTTAANKDRMLSAFRDSFTRELVEMPSVETIEEMKQCVRDGSYIGGGAKDDKDDRVMASALAHIAWMDNLRVQLMAQGVTKKRAVEVERQMNASGKPSVIGHMLQDFNRSRGIRH